MTNTNDTSTKQFASGMWKLMMAKAIVLIIVGLILLLFPEATLTTLIFIMGLYWLVDGIVTTYTAITSRNVNHNWKWGLFIGLIGIIAGIVVLGNTFSTAVITTNFLMWFLGLVAVINGVSGLVAGIRIKRQHTGEKSMIWGGIFSIVLGIILISSPMMSALAIMKIIGGLSLFAGLIILLIALRLKKKSENYIES